MPDILPPSAVLPVGFTPVAGSWFLDEGNPLYESQYKATLCDAASREPDRIFGPAKWDGLPGPLTAGVLLTVTMRDYDQWQEAAEALMYDDSAPDPGPPSPWPGRINVSLRGALEGLLDLDGVLVASRQDLLEKLSSVTVARGPFAVPMASADERLSHARGQIPGL